FGAGGQARSQLIYWANVNGFAHNGGSIHRAKLHGPRPPETPITGRNAPTGAVLNLVGGQKYLTNIHERQSCRDKLDGTGQEPLVRGQNGPAHLALDLVGGKMYWPNSTGSDIRRANLDGSGQEILIQGLAGPSQVALDVANSWIYWVEHVGGQIRRAK